MDGGGVQFHSPRIIQEMQAGCGQRLSSLSVSEISPEWSAEIARVTGKYHQLHRRSIAENEALDIARFCQAGERLGGTGVDRPGGSEVLQCSSDAWVEMDHQEDQQAGCASSQPPGRATGRSIRRSMRLIHWCKSRASPFRRAGDRMRGVGRGGVPVPPTSITAILFCAIPQSTRSWVLHSPA